MATLNVLRYGEQYGVQSVDPVTKKEEWLYGPCPQQEAEKLKHDILDHIRVDEDNKFKDKRKRELLKDLTDGGMTYQEAVEYLRIGNPELFRKTKLNTETHELIS